MKRPAPWPLPKLLAKCRNAATVFVAVATLAAGKRQVNTTRGSIRSVCGLSLRSIGTALAGLHRADWLSRSYGRSGEQTWYRLTLLSAIT